MTEREIEILVAAFYDGELSPNKRRIVADLLRQNACASRYLVGLQRLGRQLKSLPIVGKPVDLELIPADIACKPPDTADFGMDPGDFLHGLTHAPEQILTAFRDGLLSGWQRVDVEQGLLTQSGYREYLESLQDSRVALNSLPRLTVPESVGKAIQNAIRIEANRIADDAKRSNSANDARGSANKPRRENWSFGNVLTAYLDGELPTRRRAMVERALNRSRRGRLFLRHHAEIKNLLGELAIQKLDKETFRDLVDKAVVESKVGDRTGAIIAAAAETVPNLSHDPPRHAELPAAKAPIGGFFGFRGTGYIALAASVVLVLAFAELAFNRTGLLSSTRGRLAAIPTRTDDESKLAPEVAGDPLIHAKPLEGSIPNRKKSIVQSQGRPSKSSPKPEGPTEPVALAIDALASLSQQELVERLSGKQVRLVCTKADEIYDRVFLALRQDDISLPAKLAIPDLRPAGAAGGKGVIALDLALTPLQWRGLIDMLKKLETAESLIAKIEVTSPSLEMLAVLRKNEKPAERPEVVIVPSLVIGSGPLAAPGRNLDGGDDWKSRSLTPTGRNSHNPTSRAPNEVPKKSANDVARKYLPSPPRETDSKVRVVVIFEEPSK